MPQPGACYPVPPVKKTRGYPAAGDMTATDTAKVFAALDRLIAASNGFVCTWGAPDAAMLERLEAFAGYRLPDDFRAFALPYGNANVGYVPVAGLGPVGAGVPAAQALTEERRAEWRSFPSRCLALGEENTDLIVLRADGAVEIRTESSRDLSVFKTFPTFTAFLRDAIESTVEQGKAFGRLPDAFDVWRAAG
jgi:hypothetical protein